MRTRARYGIAAGGIALVALAGALALLFFRAEAGAPTVDLTGEWNLEFTGEISAACTLEITQTGEDVSGPWQCSPYGEGSFTGTIHAGPDGITFDFDAEIGALTIQAEGTVSADGMRVDGTWQAQLGEVSSTGDFSATRKPPATPTATPTAVTSDISGHWNLQLEGSLITTCDLVIAQDGDQLSGSWSCAFFGEGTYEGVVVEATGGTSFTLDGEFQGIPFEAEGMIAPSGDSATGTWHSDQGPGYSGTFLATRKLGPAPTATTTTPAPEGVIGDANCNETADATDAALILQLSAALVDELACQGNADVNGDGRVDAIDASLILQFVAGLLEHLPP